MASDRYFIGPTLLGEIRRTIRVVGDTPESESGPTQRSRFQTLGQPTGGGDGALSRLCKTTTAFLKGTVATLDVWEDGDPPNETQTEGQTVADVVNKYADIPACTFVSVAKHGNGRWYVVSAEV